MFTDEYGNIFIYVKVHLPWAPGPITKRITADPSTFAAFRPLPENRDLPDEFGAVTLVARQEAARMEHDRYGLAQHLAKNLAASILQAIESRDPQHGYSPEEPSQ